jgi:hypothetical protein
LLAAFLPLEHLFANLLSVLFVILCFDHSFANLLAVLLGDFRLLEAPPLLDDFIQRDSTNTILANLMDLIHSEHPTNPEEPAQLFLDGLVKQWEDLQTNQGEL